MPELPEVETVRRGLERSVVGATVADVAVTGPRTVRRQPVGGFVRSMRGRKIGAVDRRGKFLLVRLDEGTLAVHLRMSGQLVLVEDVSEDKPPHTHATFLFDDGRSLLFVDARTFGELFYCGPGGVDLDEALGGLGVDPLVDTVDARLLGALFSKRKAAVKSLLLDQRLICGIGNIYADEICFAAGVRPTRPAGSLRRGELVGLSTAIADVLAEAVELRGSSLRDARYRDLFGEPGEYQSRHAVYGRTKQPCPRCGRAVERVVIAGRSAHFCRHCQR